MASGSPSAPIAARSGSARRQGAGAGHSHPTSLYVMKADGSGLRRLTQQAPARPTVRRSGPPTASKLVAYELSTRDTFGARMHGAGIAALGSTSQIVEIDVATGARDRGHHGAGAEGESAIPAGRQDRLRDQGHAEGWPAARHRLLRRQARSARARCAILRGPPTARRVVYYRIDVKNRPQYSKLYSWDKKREYRYTDVFPTVCPKNRPHGAHRA